jgi:hypothetical protein
LKTAVKLATWGTGAISNISNTDWFLATIFEGEFPGIAK